MPRISVIIPSYNRRNFLVEAVESVFRQTYRDFEILVVDDGSTDGTEDAIRSRYPQVRYLRLGGPFGPAAARNAGIREASGDILAFLDSDDLWLPNKLERQIQYLEKYPARLVSYTDEIWIRNGRRVNPRKKHHKHSGWIFAHSLRLCIVSPSSVLMRRSFWDFVGVFDESFPVCEDYELWLRASCRMPFVFVPERLIVKRGGHRDQLSKHWGMDVFRVRALLKLLLSHALSTRQTFLTLTELARKCEILEIGFRKHGKVAEAELFGEIGRWARQVTSASRAPGEILPLAETWERRVRYVGEAIRAQGTMPHGEAGESLE